MPRRKVAGRDEARIRQLEAALTGIAGEAVQMRGGFLARIRELAFSALGIEQPPPGRPCG